MSTDGRDRKSTCVEHDYLFDDSSADPTGLKRPTQGPGATMAYSEILAERVTQALSRTPQVETKKMMGGRTFMVNAKMCVGILGDDLMARIDPEAHAPALLPKTCNRSRQEFREQGLAVRLRPVFSGRCLRWACPSRGVARSGGKGDAWGMPYPPCRASEPAAAAPGLPG